MAKNAETQTPGNGHDADIKSKLDAFLDMDVFSGAFSQPQMSSALEKFIERGDKVEDLLLRGHFRDVNHMNAVIRLYRKAVHYKDTELQQLLLNHAAGYPAIGGMRIDILKQAVVGQLSESKKNNIRQNFKKALGLGEDNK